MKLGVALKALPLAGSMCSTAAQAQSTAATGTEHDYATIIVTATCTGTVLENLPLSVLIVGEDDLQEQLRQNRSIVSALEFAVPGLSVEASESRSSCSPGERLVHTADPLHFGTFGGLATKLVSMLFGLLLTGLAVTGAIVYAKRTGQVLRHGVDLPMLDLLGPLKWPSLALVTVVPAAAFVFW